MNELLFSSFAVGLVFGSVFTWITILIAQLPNKDERHVAELKSLVGTLANTIDTQSALKNELAKASSKRESVAESIPPVDPTAPAMPAEWLELAEKVFRQNEEENAATIAGDNPFKAASPDAIKSRDMRNLSYTLSAYRYNGRLPGSEPKP